MLKSGDFHIYAVAARMSGGSHSRLGLLLQHSGQPSAVPSAVMLRLRLCMMQCADVALDLSNQPVAGQSRGPGDWHSGMSSCMQSIHLESSAFE